MRLPWKFPKITRQPGALQVRVLYIVTAYDRYPGDGITPWLVRTIRHLGRAGVEVEVLAPSYRGLGDGLVDRVPVHRFRYAPQPLETLTHDQTAPDRIRQRPWMLALVPGYLWSASRAARRLARTGRFDVVHVHWPIPHAIPGFAARRAGRIPLVSTFHGVELTWTRRQLPFLVPFLRRVIRRSDAVTANSSYTVSMIREVHDRAVERIPFGATVTAEAADGRDASAAGVRGGHARGRNESAPFQLLFVGRLVERKGLAVLLEALAGIVDRHAVRLRVVGAGPARESLERRARALGVDHVVQFEGFVPDDVLAEAYRTADLFVLPAVYDAKGDVEGLGVVLVEAAASGLPAVASDAGGIPDVVRHGETGFLVPPGDPGALAAAVVQALADRDRLRRMGEAAKRHAAREFSWDVITERLVSLYRRVA